MTKVLYSSRAVTLDQLASDMSREKTWLSGDVSC